MNAKIIPVACAAAILSGCATLKEPAPDTLIAHRGESVDAPENTLPAYRVAVERGFGFECDIYLSRDGRLFTFHDSDLKRTTAGARTEKCTEASWDETVSKVNVGGWGKWKGSKFDPTRPALLEEVLALARPGRKIYVEVKGGDAAVAWVPAIKAVFAKEPKATPETVLFICFSDKTCAELKRLMPEFQTYWLTTSRKGVKWDGKDRERPVHSAEDVIARLRACGADGVDIHFDPTVVDAAYVKKVHDAGFSFHVWTVDNLERAKQAFAVGADSLTTNCAKKILDGYLAER